jgi:flagellar FliL protein
MSPLMITASVVGLAILALALVLFVLKPLLLRGDRAASKAGPSRTFSLGTVVVNVAETEGRRYLKTSVELAINGTVPKELETRKSQFVDLLITVLSSKSLAEVTSAEGREGIKTEILDRINAELGNASKVQRVFFTEFVVQ